MNQKFSDSIDGCYSIGFKIKWPERGDKPNLVLDLIIAHRIISPRIADNKDVIRLWRFHRSANRDNALHLFTFEFCSTKETAGRIMKSIESDPLLRDMKNRSYVISCTCERIEDFCGENWLPALKKSWPYFSMGVSQTWLHLIDEISREESGGREFSTPEEMLKLYKEVDETIIQQYWFTEGCHIYLHHINAIFGYGPILVDTFDMKRIIPGFK